MENVKGFDSDTARDTFIQMLKNEKYNYQVRLLINWIIFLKSIFIKKNYKEFLLSPIQFGIPNSRLRYFLIAKLEEKLNFETQLEISNNFSKY